MKNGSNGLSTGGLTFDTMLGVAAEPRKAGGNARREYLIT